MPPMLLLFYSLERIIGGAEARRRLPDCLEGDHATTDSVWANLHDVYLACNPARLVKQGKMCMEALTEERQYLHHCRVLRGPVEKLSSVTGCDTERQQALTLTYPN